MTVENPFTNCSASPLMDLPRFMLAALLLAVCALAAEDPADPWVDRIEPLGGRLGVTVDARLTGKNLAAPATLEFDSPHLSWETDSLTAEGVLQGRIRIHPDAALGPHIATLVTPAGRANSRLFNVDELPSTPESEPNNTRDRAQLLVLQPQVLQGAMHELTDIDFFAFDAQAGQLWSFDLRSLEYGGFLENDMTLVDSSGRQVAFNDDRNDYLETPFLTHTFQDSGRYYLKLDQYRGPQRVNCARNCVYMLRISQLPQVEAAFPLGARIGSLVSISITGQGLATIETVWLAPARRAEYYRLTFPYTIPMRTDDFAAQRLEGKILDRQPDRLTVRFKIPDNTRSGLWRLWSGSPSGITDSLSFEISDMPEPDCREITLTPEGAACNGSLETPGEEDEYWITLQAGQPLVATTLAVQLGLPAIDTVLELYDTAGNLLAEHDDLMSGQGTVIGNPDSLLFYKPATAGKYRLVVHERIDRGGPDMVYRLRLEQRLPGFALLSDPEALNVVAGNTQRVGVLLVREPGFDEAVQVWIDEPHPGISVTGGSFRADQFFGPSADGDNIVIPETFLDVKVAADLPAGNYPLRILGQRVGGQQAPVVAISTLWIGPPRKRNDVRRPLEQVSLTVLEPGKAASLSHEAEPASSP